MAPLPINALIISSAISLFSMVVSLVVVGALSALAVYCKGFFARCGGSNFAAMAREAGGTKLPGESRCK